MIKKALANLDMRKQIQRLVYIIVAVSAIAAAVNMFLGPHNIAAGGITGLAIILESLLGLHRATVILIANVLVLAAAFFLLGREIFFNTLVGALLLPGMIRLIPQMQLVESSVLSMAAGSVLFGMAVSLMYHHKASSGGTAVPPMIFHKYFGLNKAVGLFVSDGMVVLASLLVFSVDEFFYAVFSIFITSMTMRGIEKWLARRREECKFCYESGCV